MTTFLNRKDAARRLAEQLHSLELRDPIVLGIPRGGVLTAAALASALNADMDVILARKLRHPQQPELAIGAIAEDGEVHLNRQVMKSGAIPDEYLQAEREERFAELERRRTMFRNIRPAANLEGRSIIVTDDGIATGSTIRAALAILRAKQPHELIVAVPVASPSSLEHVRRESDRVVCLHAPRSFMAIGQYYEQFDQVSDEQACDALRQFAPAH